MEPRGPGAGSSETTTSRNKGLAGFFFFFFFLIFKSIQEKYCVSYHQSFTRYHLETDGSPLASLAFGIWEPEYPPCVRGAVVPRARVRISDSLKRTAYQWL